MYVACICQEIHDGLLLTSGMFIHIFNEEEMNDINLDDSTFMYSKQILGCAKIYKSRTSYWYNGPVFYITDKDRRDGVIPDEHRTH